MGVLKSNRKEYFGDEVRLADLSGDDGVIEGFRFKNCHVKGPGVLVVQGEFNLVDNTFEGDPDAFLWEIRPDRERVIGAILIKDTTFEGCTFTSLGLAGYPDFIEHIKQGVASQSAIS